MSAEAERIVQTLPVNGTRRLLPRGWRMAHEYSGSQASRALSPLLIAAHDADCPRTEALRELRSQLVVRWFKESRTLAVIAPRGHEGSSVVAANLAIAFAQLGEPTLLVDANFREPHQHELFGLNPAIGLADVLRDCDLQDEALVPVPAFENLRVLCTGTAPANSQELVTRSTFAYLMKTFPSRFRAVIVDTPPALVYADAQVIASRTRGCILVTRRHHTRVTDITRIRAQLAPAGTEILGAVINE